MADPTFLKQLQIMRETYHPHWLDITPVTLNELAFDLIEVGRLAQTSMPHDYHASVVNLLFAISARSLSMLRCKDYIKLFEEIESLHSRKNAGYAGVGTNDPWMNFRCSRWFGVTPFHGCLVRMSDKFTRICNLAKDPRADQVGESIKDTLQDLAVYALIAICLWEEEQSAVRCEMGLVS